MPRMQFTNLERLNYLNNAILTHKHDQEDTALVALTHREMACVMMGKILTSIFFPEHDRVLDEFTDKLQMITQGTGFFDSRFRDPPEGEDPEIDYHPGGD